MIKLNTKVKLSISFLFSICLSGVAINKYKKLYDTFEVDLNKIYSETITKENKLITSDPFEIIFKFDEDEYLIDKVYTSLYNPPLTNKLYPKSNLYGHELIRYFDK